MAIKKISANLLGNNAVTAASIAGGAISAADIADNSITAAKLSASTSPTFGGLTSTGDVSIGGADSNNAVLSLTADTGNWVFTNVRASRNLEISDSDGTGTVLTIDTSGNVGIGTSSPDHKLHLKQNANTGINIQVDNTSSTSYIDFGDSADDNVGNIEYIHSSDTMNFKTNAQKRLTIDSSGNVGIGQSAPNAPLEVVKNITFADIDTFPQMLIRTASGSTGDQLGLGVDTANSVAFIQAVEKGINVIPLSLQRYGGNVGIGTSNPAHPLMVSRSGTGINAFFTNTTDADLGINLGSGITLLTPTTGTLAFGTSSTERMRIDSSGNVGIGTSSPNARLEIKPAASSNYLQFNDSSDTEKFRINSNFQWAWGTTTPSQDFDMRNTSGNAFFALDRSNGRVGIGTDSPYSKQHNVITSSGTALLLNNSSGGAGAYVDLDFNTYPVTITGYANAGATIRVIDDGNYSGNITFRTKAGSAGGSQTERMRITSSGDLLLGTISGTYGNAKLYVSHGINGSTASPALTLEGLGYGGLHYLDGTAYYLGQNSSYRSVRIWSGASTASGVELSAGGTSWSSFSDERLKENIQDIGSVTEKIKDIRCVTFNRTDIEDSKETIGFIAQDFIGKFDQVLNKSKLKDDDDEEYYSIKYTETIPVLLKAIQEQQVLIEQLQAEVALLKGE